MNTSDGEIIKQIQGGDNTKYADILDRYADKIERYVRRMVSGDEDVTKDIVQDTFIKAYININSFDIEKKFGPWVYRIAHNECVNYYKKKKNVHLSFFEFDTIFPGGSDVESQLDYVLRKENKSKIESVINQLDVKYKEVIVLNYFEDLDYKEIAIALGIPISTVGVRIMRAKKLLEKYLNIYEK